MCAFIEQHQITKLRTTEVLLQSSKEVKFSVIFRTYQLFKVKTLIMLINLPIWKLEKLFHLKLWDSWQVWMSPHLRLSICFKFLLRWSMLLKRRNTDLRQVLLKVGQTSKTSWEQTLHHSPAKPELSKQKSTDKTTTNKRSKNYQNSSKQMWNARSTPEAWEASAQCTSSSSPLSLYSLPPTSL